MAQRLEIQYVQFYTDGSAARKAAPVSEQKPLRQPKPRKQRQPVVRIEPVAILGVAAAVCLFVMMVVGLVQFYSAQRQLQAMEAYVNQLNQQNQQLQQEYKAGYDLEEIRKVAEALGMIPKEQVESVLIRVPAQEQVPEPSFWEKVGTFLSGLFA